MKAMEIINKDVTDKILRAFYNVYNELGFGFAEKVYENSLLKEMRSMGLVCANQVPIKVFYKGENVGLYFADIVVSERVILEIKAAAAIAPEHEAQLFNYLKATDIETGLVLNFGMQPQFRRKVFSNELKKNPRTSARSV